MKLDKTTLTIRYATPADSERLTDFRISQFKTAKEFILLIPELLSRQSGHIYLVEQDGCIVSTMQVEKCISKDTFKYLSGSYFMYDEPNENLFPSFYLSKAGTIKDLRNSGINSYLRLLTLYSAIEDNSINSLTGVAFENAPRLNLLEKIGYDFIEIAMEKDDYTLPLGKTFFFVFKK